MAEKKTEEKPGAEEKPKYKSGAQKRKERRQREAQIRPAGGELRAILDRIGQPPSAPTAILLWAHKVAAALLWANLMEPDSISPAQLRLAREFIGVLGMTYPRAELEELADKGDPRKKAKVSATTVPTPVGAWTKNRARAAGEQGEGANLPPPEHDNPAHARPGGADDTRGGTC